MGMQELESLSQFVLRYQGREYPLNKAFLMIGHDQSSDIRIQDNPQVLPMHARVMYREGHVMIRYMVREATIWVNGEAVSQAELHDQDVIAVGDRDTTITLSLAKYATALESPGSQTHLLAASQSVPSQPLAGMFSPQTDGLRPLPGQSGALFQQTTGPTTVGLASMPGQSGALFQQAGGSGLKNMRHEATRYLCAAAHLNESFQDYVMRHVVHEEHRALGESYGVDMFTVVSWCKAGVNRLDVRDVILTGIIGLYVISYFVMLVTLITSIQQYAANGPGSIFSSVGLVLSLLGSVFLLVPVLIGLLIAFQLEKWAKRRWPKVYPGVISYLIILISGLSVLQAFPAFSVLLFAFIWFTIFGELLQRYYGDAVHRLRKDKFDPARRPAALEPDLEKKLQESFVTGQRNVVAYSGTRPFAGGGYNEGGWSFIVDTSIGSPKRASTTVTNLGNGKDINTVSQASGERNKPAQFAVSSLYEAVKKDMLNLGLNEVLEIEEKIYVRGQFIQEHPPFFNEREQRPVTSVDPQLVAYYKEHPSEDVRYYQCLRFNFWRGEMIFTVFLRFVQHGKDLFTEVNYLLLPPMDPSYYWIDNRENTPILRGLWMLFKLSFQSPLQTWLGAPYRLTRGYRYAAQQRKNARIARNMPAFDYGAASSLRFYASDDKYHLFFQEMDQRMYLKVAQKQILQSLGDFLDAHNIDTSEFMESQNQIISNTTINSNSNNDNRSFKNSGSNVNFAAANINQSPGKSAGA